MELRKDPTANAVMGGAFTQQNAAVLAAADRAQADRRRTLHRRISSGPMRAPRLINLAASNPNANAAEIFPVGARVQPADLLRQGRATRAASPASMPSSSAAIRWPAPARPRRAVERRRTAPAGHRLRTMPVVRNGARRSPTSPRSPGRDAGLRPGENHPICCSRPRRCRPCWPSQASSLPRRRAELSRRPAARPSARCSNPIGPARSGHRPVVAALWSTARPEAQPKQTNGQRRPDEPACARAAAPRSISSATTARTRGAQRCSYGQI